MALRWAILLSPVCLLTGCTTARGMRVEMGEGTPIVASHAAAQPLPILLAANPDPPTSGAPTDKPTQGYNVPGRRPDSQAPWEVFMGNAAHRLIAYIYQVNHPRNRTFYNAKRITDILAETGVGDPSRLLESERQLRPDITDVTVRVVFEIKPWNDAGLQDGRREVQIYLTALNRAVLPGRNFAGGTDFRSEVLIRFARGQYIWRLEWQTTEPGVTLYRWTRSRERFAAEAAAHQAGQWVAIDEQEMQQYGGWVAQAVDGMVSRRESLASLSGTIGVAIDLIGNVAVGVFSGVIFGQMGSRPGTQPSATQPPAQGGGQVIPFPPTKVPPAAAPAPLPAASGK